MLPASTLNQPCEKQVHQDCFDWMLSCNGGCLSSDELRQASRDIQFGKMSNIIVIEIRDDLQSNDSISQPTVLRTHPRPWAAGSLRTHTRRVDSVSEV